MPPIPERIHVSFPLTHEREQQVFQISVIRRRANEYSSGSESRKASATPLAWSIEMLYHFCADHDIERRLIQLSQYVSVRGEEFKTALGMGDPRLSDSLFAQIDPDTRHPLLMNSPQV